MKKKQTKLEIPYMKDNEWIYPEPKNFGLVCCDCGLVHSMDFQVILLIPIGSERKDGNIPCRVWEAPECFSMRFRARRNKKLTSRVRKERNLE